MVAPITGAHGNHQQKVVAKVVAKAQRARARAKEKAAKEKAITKVRGMVKEKQKILLIPETQLVLPIQTLLETPLVLQQLQIRPEIQLQIQPDEKVD